MSLLVSVVVKPLACADLSRLIRRLYWKDKLEQRKGEGNNH